ncbi:MAG TPA: serine hydrolase [Saprospiraceae bacterium]|nr:serine hydrolase [Saprospiraceae bacterium]HMP23548.1 serine hydrolase [Saprospiraceae bacterium]
MKIQKRAPRASYRLRPWGTFLLLFCCVLLIHPTIAQKNILQQILKQHAADWDTLLQQPEKYQVQIVYTQIDRDAQNRPTFKTFTHGVDTNRYFYPASTIKMPTALLALEKINSLSIRDLDKYSPMITGAGRYPQRPVVEDTSAENGMPSVAHYIRKVFLVSDNDAHNRLYEFLGQAQLNQQLYEKGYRSSRILHRLSVSGFDAEGNRHTNPVSFNGLNKLLYHQGEVYSQWAAKLNLRQQVRGKGYENSEGNIVNEPFDFRERNFISILDLHRILTAVMLPEGVAPHERFHLTEDDYRFVWQCMSELPRESRYPKYPAPNYWDSYVKFLLFGDSKEPMPNNIRIFNKVGVAYGFLTDIAYVVDFDNKVEFLLSATIHVNENQIYNDGVYEYETIGHPFLAKLGRAIHAYEKNRPRKYAPDLSKYQR